MGLDFEEIVVCCEKEFDIQLSAKDFAGYHLADMMVGDILTVVREAVRNQNPHYDGDTAREIREIISEVCGVPTNEIIFTTKLRADLNI